MSSLRALAVYLLVFQHVPVERCALLIADLTGAHVSTGWVSGLLGQAATVVKSSLKLIRALLTLGHVPHADETTIRIGSGRRRLHVACTERLTLLGLGPRSREGANALGVLPNFRGVVVHDSLALYNGYPDARHQLCGAHYSDLAVMPTLRRPAPMACELCLMQGNRDAKKQNPCICSHRFTPLVQAVQALPVDVGLRQARRLR